MNWQDAIVSIVALSALAWLCRGLPALIMRKAKKARSSRVNLTIGGKAAK